MARIIISILFLIGMSVSGCDWLSAPEDEFSEEDVENNGGSQNYSSEWKGNYNGEGILWYDGRRFNNSQTKLEISSYTGIRLRYYMWDGTANNYELWAMAITEENSITSSTSLRVSYNYDGKKCDFNLTKAGPQIRGKIFIEYSNGKIAEIEINLYK